VLELKQPLPAGRTYDSVLRHFEVERSIAERLKAATRAGRKAIYETMYDELWAQVPDHPRLTRREDPLETRRRIERLLPLVQCLVRPSSVYLEFAPGDCRFAFEVARHVAQAYGVEISDQTGPSARFPANFRLVIYDGYDLDLPDESVDVVYSDQLIEHLHPEDTELHFRLVRRLLRPGGRYLFRTPHRHSGPHDVSQFFSDEPQGFHLKEWTYGELTRLLSAVGYRSVSGCFWAGGRRLIRLPRLVFAGCETISGRLPRVWARRLDRGFPRGITMIARK